MLCWLRAILCLIVVSGLSTAARATPPGRMQPSEIEALQRRLTDARCYAGPIDGQSSDDVMKAIAACPSQEPQLRIETGMHVAPIYRVAVDEACTLAATGSEDKTVRLWSLPEGRLLRTLRVPIEPGLGGEVYAVILWPDGRLVAAGGQDALGEKTGAYGLYIFDAASGEVKARIGAFESWIENLALSPDGRFVAATLHAKGVRMIDTATSTEVASDKAYGDRSDGAVFGPDGRLYTVARDGKLRRYGPGPSFQKEQEIPIRGGRQPSSVSIDPGGHLLAIGFEDSIKVEVYDAQSLAFRFAADTKGFDIGNLGVVAWSKDGRRLIAGGTYEIQIRDQWKYGIVSFGQNGHRLGPMVPLADNGIMDFNPCGEGLAVAAADPAFGLLGADGTRKLWKAGVAPDMRDKVGTDFMVSDDARRVRFGLEDPTVRPVLFDLTAASLTDAPKAPPKLTQPRVEGLPVTNWRDRTDPQLGGKPLGLEPSEMSRSLAIRRDGTGFVLAASLSLRSFDPQGHLRWTVPALSDAWGVNLSADGRIVVAAYGDGTIHWHRWSDGQEVLALFVDRNTRAWVAWTPSGYYKASPGGEDLIGWHINRGWDQAADFFPASRFRDTFSRPDIVGLVLDTLDEAAAVQQANAGARRRDDQRGIIERLPPVLTILAPAEGAVIDQGTVDIRYAARSPSGAPVDRVDAFVDGAKVQAKGLVRVEEASNTLTLPMPDHDATISLVAYAGGLAGDAVRLALKRTVEVAPGSDAAALKPTLYALLIGVTHYDNPKFDLEYAAKDAADFAAALQSQKGKLYRNVEVKVLTDKDATATAVKKGLLWLQKQTTARDLAIVFASGHGTTDAKGKFWFLTADADPEQLLATAVSRDDIADILFDLPGKKLLFLDACHSGAALNAGTKGLERTPDISTALGDFTQAEGGVVAYAASTGHEFSFEREEWGHGAFTKALIEGFEGKADLLHKGTVTTATLDAFLEDRVKELTGGQQHPVMTRPKTVPDFPIALTP